jgi:hypothetical protein
MRWAAQRIRYGITREQWEALFERQGRKCAICPSTSPRAKRGWHTDHDHGTGAVRGILCGPCNRLVGAYEDALGPSVLAYLASPPALNPSALP